MHQFIPNGPVFTYEHQFLSDLQNMEIGVVSKKALVSTQPQFEEANVKELQEIENVLQLIDGNITLAKFKVVPYKKMKPSTLVYTPVTNGEDGTYIVDNFVSRDVLPDVEKWPLTYGTLGVILKSCNIDIPFTLEGEQKLMSLSNELFSAWKKAIFYKSYKNGIEKFEFDPLVESATGVEVIFSDLRKFRFAQYLQGTTAKFLHEYLDDENTPLNERFTMIKSILDITKDVITCDFTKI